MLKTGENKQERNKGKKEVVSPSLAATSFPSGLFSCHHKLSRLFAWVFCSVLLSDLLFLLFFLLFCSLHIPPFLRSVLFCSVLFCSLLFSLQKQLHILHGYRLQICKTDKNPGFAIYIQDVEDFFHSSHTLSIHFCYTHTHTHARTRTYIYFLFFLAVR